MGKHYEYLKRQGVEEAVRAEFDERYYLETYAGSIDPDVDPFLDFIEVGWKAGRNPSPDFDTSYYLGVNYDVAHAGREPLTHYVRRGRAEGRSPNPHVRGRPEGRSATRWTDEDVVETRARVLVHARANLELLPAGFVERHSTVQVTLLMLSQERLDQTTAAIRSIQDNVAIAFRLLVIDNGSNPETQRRLGDMFAADDRITFVMREDNLGCAGGRNFGVERIDTDFTMLVDNDLEVMPGAVEHLLHRLESEPHAAATTAMVILPNGKVQLCGATYRRDADVLVPLLHGSGLDFEERFDVPGSCDWLAGGASLFRTELLRTVPFDEGMTYYEDNDWALRLPTDGREWTLHPVPESLTIHHTNPVQVQSAASIEESRRSRLARAANFATLYNKHGFVHGDVFAFLPELGSPNVPKSIENAKRIFALLAEVGPKVVAKRWQGGQLDYLFAAAEVDASHRTGPDGVLFGSMGRIWRAAIRRLRRVLASRRK